jgi:hypothetical protein
VNLDHRVQVGAGQPIHERVQFEVIAPLFVRSSKIAIRKPLTPAGWAVFRKKLPRLSNGTWVGLTA